MARPHRRGSALSVLLAAGSLVALIVLGSSSAFWSRTVPKRSPSPAGALLLATRLGLDPEALAAAGVTVQQIPAVVSAARTTWQDIGNDLDAKDETVRTAQQTLDSITQAKAAGGPSANAAASLATARATLQSARTQRDSILNDAFAALTTDLSGDQIALLQTIKRNRTWRVPVYLMTVDRTPAQWLLLQNGGAPAIDRENPRMPSRGEPPTPANASAIATANDNATVAAARTRLQSAGPAIETAYKSGFADVAP